jgi:hypothetical protein
MDSSETNGRLDRMALGDCPNGIAYSRPTASPLMKIKDWKLAQPTLKTWRLA